MDTPLAPRVVAIGASGSQGLDDLRNLLAIWPIALSVVIMAVLHRPSEHHSFLRDVLQKRSRVPVVVAEDGDPLLPGVCYLGQPDRLIALGSARHAALIDGTSNRFRNRTIDILFKSVAREAGAASVGIVLSGALDDGGRGLAAIHDAGGITMVLDPGDKPRGMQRNAIDYDGAVTFVGDLLKLAQALGGLITGDNADVDFPGALDSKPEKNSTIRWQGPASGLIE